jgi:hypothetical protein
VNLQLYLQDFTPFLLQAEAPHLLKLCAVGQWQRYRMPLTACLLNRFNIKQQNDWPTAALVAQAMGEVQQSRYYLLAHLVHLDLRTDYFALQTLEDISEQQTDAIVDSLNQHFSEQDIYFSPTHHAHTLLISCPQPADIFTHEINQVWGNDVRSFMPSGDDALRWRMLINEIQMLLHQHAVNMQREQDGLLAINSIWIEGGGQPPSHVTQGKALLVGDDDMLRGLAQLSGSQHLGLPKQFSELASQQDLIIYLSTPAQLDTDWAAPLWQALRTAKIKQLSIYFAVAEFTFSVSVRPVDAWKFWRIKKPLMHYFSERHFSHNSA